MNFTPPLFALPSYSGKNGTFEFVLTLLKFSITVFILDNKMRLCENTTITTFMRDKKTQTKTKVA